MPSLKDAESYVQEIGEESPLEESGQHYLNDYHILASMSDNRLKDCILRYRNLAKLAEQELLARKEGLRCERPVFYTNPNVDCYRTGDFPFRNPNSRHNSARDKRLAKAVKEVNKGIKLLSKKHVNLDYVIRSLLNGR